jgi:hypothetical protein
MVMPISSPADPGPGGTRVGLGPSELPPRLFEAQHRSSSPPRPWAVEQHRRRRRRRRCVRPTRAEFSNGPLAAAAADVATWLLLPPTHAVGPSATRAPDQLLPMLYLGRALWTDNDQDKADA